MFHAATAGAFTQMKTRILIVEDDAHIALGLEEVLKSDGFEPVVCHRGDKALAAVERERPQLVVLDVMLPGKSGYDLCKELRAKMVWLQSNAKPDTDDATTQGTAAA